MASLYISDLPLSDVCIIVSSDSPLPDVIQLMHSKGQSCAIMTQAGKPCGIITERDLVRLLKQLLENSDTSSINSMSCAEVMSCPVQTVNLDTPSFDALVLCRSRDIRHLPIINDEGNLIGAVTQSQITRAHLHAIEKQRIIIDPQSSEQHSAQLQADNNALQKANVELKTLAMEDGLLGIGNRRAMEIDLRFTHSSAERYQTPYSVALIDVDYFKKYNDHYGHQAGDKALISITQAINSAIRNTDQLYRYGGEEFLLIMHETQLSQAQQTIDRALQAVRDLKEEHRTSEYKILTVSAGIVSFNTESSWQELVEKSDQTLYQAKESGRDRYVSFE